MAHPVKLDRSLLPGSRDEAIEKRARYYFTGEQCRNGHDSERYTMNGVCRECLREGRRRYINRAREALQEV